MFDIVPLMEQFGISKIKTRILKDSSIKAFADYVKENQCKNIIVLTGAGISTSAGTMRLQRHSQ
jgi:2-hydroxy-3-keto-5-methylthiopentenyl-1-phosphate phosphatase